MWKLNNTLLNEHWVRKITGKKLKLNNNENEADKFCGMQVKHC